MNHLSDTEHLDPCRVCGTLLRRSAMIPAARYFRKPSRGYVCHGCVARRKALGY